MSGPAGAPSPAPRSTSIGPGAGGMGMPPQPTSVVGGMGGGSSGAGGAGGQSTMSQQNLNQIVIEYLNKKGYNKTEAMLRAESSNQESDGSVPNRPADADRVKYGIAFVALKVWIDSSLVVYQPELRRMQWPVFVHSFLNLVAEGYPEESRRFYEANNEMFENEHVDDLRQLKLVTLPEHLQESEIAKKYRGAKWTMTMSIAVFHSLIQFLEAKSKNTGGTILAIIHNYMDMKTVERAANDRFSFEAMMERAANSEQELPAEDEGIPGHTSGAVPTFPSSQFTDLPKLRLGPAPMDPEQIDDVRVDLVMEDSENPPLPGQETYQKHFERMIKVEDDEFLESPGLHDVPYPKPTARDVSLEVMKVKENRDRFRIEGRTGGIGTGVSVLMMTLHNTYDSITCIDFSDDNEFIAAGTQESVIRIWAVNGKPLKSTLPPEHDRDAGFSSRRLAGHSGTVFGLSFAPSAGMLCRASPHDADTRCKWLLSCSNDKTIGLWNLDTWEMMVKYQGHNKTVWDIQWGPFGHYFLSGGNDKTARLWVTDKVSCVRTFAGHDDDVDVVAFHPNSVYVFTGSSDKTVRMWSVTTGNTVRMFTGHTGNLTALACAPNGKLLASADDAGTIILWELAPGHMYKRMRGHGKGGIWSVTWSVESHLLCSGGADGTVRCWDVFGPPIMGEGGKVVGEGGTGTVKVDVGPPGSTTTSGPAKKKNAVVITADQISAFPTKKTPVFKTKFTRMNMVVAGGCYSPNN